MLYQFRDYGGLGLEKGTLNKYEQLPSLKAYKESIRNFEYKIITEEYEWEYPDYSFYWPDSDNVRGLKISDMKETKRFENNFTFPIYIVYGEQQMWTRLEQGESFLIHNINEFILLVPPFKNDKGNMSTSITIRGIKDKIKSCFN